MAEQVPAPSKQRPDLQIRAPQASAAEPVEELLRTAARNNDATASESQEGAVHGDAAGRQDASTAQTEDTIEVDWRGAKKRVSRSELVRQAIKAEEAEARAQLLETTLQKTSAAKAFVDTLDNMAPEDQEAFKQVLANPRIARQLLKATQPAGNDDESDDDIDAAISGRQAARPQQEPNEEIQVLKRGMKVLLEAEARREQATRQQTLAQQLDEVMEAYPVFKESPQGAKFARNAIITKLASSPNQKLDDVVAEHASLLHGVLQDERKSYVPDGSAMPRGPRTFQLPDSDKPYTGDDLKSGKIGKALREMFRR